MGEVEFIGADLSLIYAEFHKAYEFHEIIETECVVAERDRYQISWFELESIITRWREVIDKQLDKETKQYWLEIERKLSDLFTYRKVIDRDLWSIEYEGES